MKLKIQYFDEQDRQSIINTNNDKYLIEEQNISEGNFLVFSDIKPLEIQVADLRNDNLIQFEVLATIYEELLMRG